MWKKSTLDAPSLRRERETTIITYPATWTKTVWKKAFKQVWIEEGFCKIMKLLEISVMLDHSVSLQTKNTLLISWTQNQGKPVFPNIYHGFLDRNICYVFVHEPSIEKGILNSKNSGNSKIKDENHVQKSDCGWSKRRTTSKSIITSAQLQLLNCCNVL